MKALQSPFGSLLRHWRETRRYSQLDLALEANVSSKHVSFLETGRNQPSREMILRLSNAMDVPLRDRNLMLTAAGYASAYPERSLDAPENSQVDEALKRILEKHDPYPAVVLDAGWNVVRQNHGGIRLAGLFLDEPDVVSRNGYEILFSPNGLQPYIDNWERLAPILLMRLFRETLSTSTDANTAALFRRIETMPTTPANWRDLASRLPTGPTIDLALKKGNIDIRFFTTITTFGTPQDVTLQELRIESYFPANDATRALCERWTD
jgi:transcriptional regulator with XRE-family HTH domain